MKDNERRAGTYMAVSSVKSTSEEARELITQRKKEIYEKVITGKTENSIALGGSSFTEKQWDRLIDYMDKSLENTKEEQKERFAKKKEEWEEQKEENKIEERMRLKEDLYEKELAESKRKAAKILEESTEIQQKETK